MRTTIVTMTVQDLIRLTLEGKLNPDPISQRPPTSTGFKKYQEIIEALREGLGVGMITMRDISEDVDMQSVYPGNKFLVIDGGHRIRAFVEAYTNKFKIGGKFFKELEDTSFVETLIPVQLIECTSSEATRIFQTRNRTTAVNHIEMIMCDDQSAICKEVRSRTKYYREYKNKVHRLFDAKQNNKGELIAECFETGVNPRRKWDEYIFVAILKAIGGGNADEVGWGYMEDLIANEYKGKNLVTKNVLRVVDRFLDDVCQFRYARGKKLNGDIYSALQLVWFALYEKNQEFVITDPYQFKDKFMEAYTKLTGTGNTLYNTKLIKVGTGDHFEEKLLKEYVRSNSTNMFNGYGQRKCAEIFLEEMGDNIGVTFRDAKRSLTTKQREEMLALQGYKCAIDGKPLKLEDSVWGHDTPWAKGGKLDEGAVIRKNHNRDMGMLTIAQYKFLLESNVAA